MDPKKHALSFIRLSEQAVRSRTLFQLTSLPLHVSKADVVAFIQQAVSECTIYWGHTYVFKQHDGWCVVHPGSGSVDRSVFDNGLLGGQRVEVSDYVGQYMKWL
jgi:hypothetical protein